MIVHDQVTKIRTLFEHLASCSLKKDKEAAVLAISDDYDALATLKFLLDPYVTTGIGKKSLVFKSPQLIMPPQNADIRWLLDFVASHNTGKQDDINQVVIWLDRLNEVSAENYAFMREIITKSFRIGVTAKTVNNILGIDLIPVFSVMLAHKYSEHPEYVRGNFCITEKLDGIRCYARIENGEPHLFTRQGQLIEGLVAVERSLKRLFAGQTLDLDGELVVSNYQELPSKIAYKETVKIVRTKGLKGGITYRVFDLPSNLRYIERRAKLASLIPAGGDVVELVPILYAGEETAMIDYHLKRICAAGGEGVMINMSDAPYEYKRSSSLLKVKQMQDCDLMIIGFAEGDGALTGMLGALIVDYKGGELRVGSGFTLADRSAFWQCRNQLIGRVVSVQYFEETTDDTGKPSLRFPVFLEMREEGKEVSYS